MELVEHTELERRSWRRYSIITIIIVSVLSLLELAIVALSSEATYLRILCGGFAIISIALLAYGLYSFAARSIMDAAIYKWMQLVCSVLYCIASAALGFAMLKLAGVFCTADEEALGTCLAEQDTFTGAMLLSLGWVAIAALQVALTAVSFKYEGMLAAGMFSPVGQEDDTELRPLERRPLEKHSLIEVDNDNDNNSITDNDEDHLQLRRHIPPEVVAASTEDLTTTTTTPEPKAATTEKKEAAAAAASSSSALPASPQDTALATTSMANGNSSRESTT